MEWWNTEYLYRRMIYIAPYIDSIPAQHPITITLPEAVWANQKVRQNDLEDLEVIYSIEDNDSAIYRSIIHNDDGIHVTFQSQDLIQDENSNYAIYYGNPDLTDAPARGNIINNASLTRDLTGDHLPDIPTWARWPLEVTYQSSKIGYTRPGEHWIDGVSNKSGARATFTFNGNRVRLIGNTNQNGGLARIKVNDGSWTEIDFFNDTSSTEMMFIEFGLPSDTENELTLEVMGASTYSDSANEVSIESIQYSRAMNVEKDGEFITDLNWHSYIGGW